MRNYIKAVTREVGNFFSTIQGKELPSMLDLVLEMEHLLDVSESQPIKFELPHCSQFELVALAEGAAILANRAGSFLSEVDQPLINRVLQKSLSLQYRLEAVNGGTSPLTVQPAAVNLLKIKAKVWKESQELIKDKDLTENEIYQLQVTSQYPEYIEQLIHDDKLRGNFFRWVLRDKNEARVFIEYPSLCKKIISSNLNGRIGRVKGDGLKIQKVTTCDGSLQKVVTLPFEGVEHSILDGNHEIIFRGNYKLTVNQIFKIFEEKNLRVGNLEYLALGITNWNCHKWGFWNADKEEFESIDLDHHQWWQQLPIFEIITEEEVQERYQAVIENQAWCISATATRGSATLDYENTHAFVELAIPFGDGRYAIYDFGKFAKKYPATFFESLTIFCHNLHATVSYPDENVFYSHRQETYHTFTVNQEQGKAFLELVKADFLKGTEGNLVYQIESDNCAKWVHENLEAVVGADNVPDMFRMHLLDTEPKGAVAAIFQGIKMLPKCMQTPVMTFCHLFLGATKKTWIVENGQYVCKSLSNHEFWKTGIVYLPALLHKKIESNALATLKAFVQKPLVVIYTFIKQVILDGSCKIYTVRGLSVLGMHKSQLDKKELNPGEFGMILASRCVFPNN